MINVKIVRHSERLDATNLIYWLFFSFGYHWVDTPLSDNGYKMAEEKGKLFSQQDFNPKHIYTSPYVRTIATSSIIKTFFPQSELIIDASISEHQPYFRHRTGVYPNGIPTTDYPFPESITQLSSRTRSAIMNLLEKHDSDLLICTHGALVKAYADHLISIYPDLNLDVEHIPYLSTLSFTYDKDTNTIIKDSIQLDNC